MTKNIKCALAAKIKELQNNLILLKSVSSDINDENLKQDIIKYWGIERGIQICIECVIDISNIIISSLNTEKPDTYKETVLTLGRENIIPKNFADKVSNMVSFRNILVHDYMKVDAKIMINILKKHLDDFVEFISYINKWMKENE